MQRTVALVLVVLLGSLACSKDDGPEVGARAEQTSTKVGVAPSTPEVRLSDVRYACGPADGIVIAFAVEADADTEGVAELVVLDETFGRLPVAIAAVPASHTMGINLSQDAFDAAEGELRITGDGGVELASAPVRLRLEPGDGCG